MMRLSLPPDNNQSLYQVGIPVHSSAERAESTIFSLLQSPDVHTEVTFMDVNTYIVHSHRLQGHCVHLGLRYSSLMFLVS